MQLWRFLAAERESGQFMGFDNVMAFRPPGSFADVCLACPVPNVNMGGPQTSKWPIGNKSDRLYRELRGPDTLK